MSFWLYRKKVILNKESGSENNDLSGNKENTYNTGG